MGFWKKNKNRMIVTAVAIVLIIIIGVTSSGRASVSKPEKIIGNTFVPIGQFFSSVGKKAASSIEFIKNISTMKKENEALKIKVIELEEKNRNNEDLIGKADYLRKEAELIENTKLNLVPAQVIGKEPGNWFNRFTVDKGINHGIKKGDTVVQAIETEEKVVQEGIIGRVVEVNENSSKIVSVIDENSKISFKVIRTQDEGMVSDNANNKLNGFLFDSKVDIMKGDKLFTSGLGGIFQKDIYIGEITDVIKKDEDLMKRIEIEPAVNFKGISKVFIISD